VSNVIRGKKRVSRERGKSKRLGSSGSKGHVAAAEHTVEGDSQFRVEIFERKTEMKDKGRKGEGRRLNMIGRVTFELVGTRARSVENLTFATSEKKGEAVKIKKSRGGRRS